MPRIPIPKRSIRSIVILSVLVLGPYLLVRHLGSIGSDSPYATPSFGFGSSSSPRKYRNIDDPSPGEAPSGSSWRDVLANPVKAIGLSGRDADFTLQEDEFDISVPEEEEQEVPVKQRKGKGKDGKGSVHGKGKQMPQHTYMPNGLLRVNPEGRHPIYDLIERGQKEWDQKLRLSSKTLGQAVDEYRRRYGRPPPKGFDRWWTYVEENKVQLPDEYDQIHIDLEPFNAFTPSELQKIRKQSKTMSGMYIIKCDGQAPSRKSKSRCSYTVVEQGLNAEGRRVAHERAKAQLSLIHEIEGELEDIEAVFYSHDGPWQFVGHEYKSALEDSAQIGEYYDSKEHAFDMAYLGWASACAPHKPLRESFDLQAIPTLDEIWDVEKTFVWDHKATMDPCEHPSLAHSQGYLAGHHGGPGPSKEIFPVMAMCKTMLHSDVLGVSMEAWTEDVGDDPEWEDKQDDRLLWRGSTTGILFKPDNPWNISQRINLVAKGDQASGSLAVFNVRPDSKEVGKPSMTSMRKLNEDLIDVAFTGQPIQCDEPTCTELADSYRFGDRLDWSGSNQYKYMLDIDGNGWSARFKRLMTTNSVILKSTIFPEWYTDRVQPWVHYIPVKPDLTDMYDIMTFFRAHDDMAKNIAMAGKEWSTNFWRHEDMVAYQFRLLLEYSRLFAADRDAASYHVKGSELDAELGEEEGSVER